MTAMGRLKRIDPAGRERVLVVGDLHGDLESFQRVERIFEPGRDLIIFLGDYADRGDRGVEVIEGVDGLLRRYGDSVTALKGNHEDYRDGLPYFSPCDLIDEADWKRGGWRLYYDSFLRGFLDRLHLAAILQNVLFVHGGISSKVGSLGDLDRPPPLVEEDLMWSDPYDGLGEVPNPRGAGVLFGEDVSERVCKALGISYIVRSHEPMKAISDPFIEHRGRIATISSTGVYGGAPFILALPVGGLPEGGEGLAEYRIALA
jgi:predicted phosphodiesterase